VRLIKLLELLRWQRLSIMQQFGASAFNMVVHWHKLGEMDNECIYVILSSWLFVCQKLANLVEFDEVLTKTSWVIIWPTLYFCLLCVVTSTKEVMFLSDFVCLFVCLCVSKITQKVIDGSFWNFEGMVGMA